MSPSHSALVGFLLLSAGATNAFAPVKTTPSTAVTTTSLQFGFLKELGLEKPSWLPDFGSKKEEEPPAPAATESDDAESSEAEATDSEE
mmetsp:Transcript_15709/g.36182  ORF Transcript_15709/g.36182 Transcript_15709/m.36182 type:complete len:89 (-) Transcript_15709:204-470(-)